MASSLDPLLPAFHLLWNTAMSEYRKSSTSALVNNPKYDNPNDANNPRGANNPRVHKNSVGHDVNENEQRPKFSSKYDTKNVEWVPDSDETVVVCTLSCDQGDKFVRQVIYEGSRRTEWSRAEDLFVDWLSCELTSQHAQKVDVTIYLCCVPMETTSHGIGLWLKNIRTEGKDVNVKLKIASLGSVGLKLAEGPKEHENHNRGQIEDNIKALAKLVNNNVQIEPILSKDWITLMKLLTDHTSLENMDQFQQSTAQTLNTLIQTASK
ncbi:unnamed protein product [Lymnaea stagnalis]|uniref:Activation-induced cytidine deaminase AID domain-containing protein n=1 Tax=Lymnaea stagnalis TaxID=6523 RepID=A0AAV2IFB5_LYMST